MDQHEEEIDWVSAPEPNHGPVMTEDNRHPEPMAWQSQITSDTRRENVGIPQFSSGTHLLEDRTVL